jgi:hypothetical protein
VLGIEHSSSGRTKQTPLTLELSLKLQDLCDFSSLLSSPLLSSPLLSSPLLSSPLLFSSLLFSSLLFLFSLKICSLQICLQTPVCRTILGPSK